MRLRLLSTILVSASMAAAPAIAAPSSASKLSVARASASSGDSKLEGGSGAVIGIGLALGIVAIGVLAAVNGDDNNDNPVSA